MNGTNVADFINRLVSVIIGLAVTVLGLRFVLKLFGANPSNEIVSWVYDTSAEVLGPFRGIFDTARSGDFVIEFSTLFAVVFYMILLLVIQAILTALVPEQPVKTRRKR